MALKAVIDSVEGLSSDVQEHYAEKDGKFFLAVTSVDGLELSDPRGLKSALSKEKENASKSKKQLAEFVDIDPVKAREALGKMDEIANWTPDEKTREAQEAFESKLTTKLEKERQQQLTKFKEEQDKLATRNSILEKELHHSMIDMAATDAIVKAGAEPDLLLHKVTSRMRIQEEEGKFSVVIVDESGTPQLSTKPGEYQTPMSVEEFIAELKEIKTLAPAFKGIGATGSGARTSTSVNAGQKKHTITREQMKDFSLFRKMREAAAEDGTFLTPVD